VEVVFEANDWKDFPKLFLLETNNAGFAFLVIFSPDVFHSLSDDKSSFFQDGSIVSFKSLTLRCCFKKNVSNTFKFHCLPFAVRCDKNADSKLLSRKKRWIKGVKYNFRMNNINADLVQILWLITSRSWTARLMALDNVFQVLDWSAPNQVCAPSSELWMLFLYKNFPGCQQKCWVLMGFRWLGVNKHVVIFVVGRFC